MLVVHTASDNLSEASFQRDEVAIDVAADTGVARRAWADHTACVDDFVRSVRSRQSPRRSRARPGGARPSADR